MACSSITSFGSFLDSSTYHFFTDSKRFEDKCSHIGFIDKIFKTADPIFDLAEEVAKSHDASIDVIQGLGKGRELARAGRDATAFFNIFQGAIPSLIRSVKNVIVLLKALRKGKDGVLKKPAKGEKPQYNEIATTPAEKRWSLVENVGKIVGGASFVVGFGVCRPIGTVEKYISRNIDPTAKEIGKAFPTVMLVTHVSGVVSSTCGLVFQQLAYDRAIASNNYKADDVTKEYRKKMLENGVALSQKSIELVNSTLYHVGTVVPAAARISLNLAAGLLSVVKELIRK